MSATAVKPLPVGCWRTSGRWSCIGLGEQPDRPLSGNPDAQHRIVAQLDHGRQSVTDKMSRRHLGGHFPNAPRLVA